MNDWTAGYMADIGYTYGYYRELNPLHARLAFLNSRLVPPERGVHCELGFGQGISANIHAAASCSTWYATDFNPAQAAFAQSLAAASGADIHLADEAFSEFCSRSDLPDFDSIGLHGIWSWINDDNRSIIVEFIRRKLKVGGFVYVSYNTQPGWAAMAPLRDLLTEHSEVMGVAGHGIVNRIDGAIAFAEKLFSTQPKYLKSNPTVAERFKSLKTHSRNYLAHEYFNRDWLPMPFSRMVQWLAPAKLAFACSADYLSQIDAVNLTAEQQSLLRDVPDAMFQQTVRDFMVNQQFRKDYWARGARRLSEFEQVESLRAHRVMMVVPRADVPLKVTGSAGEATLQEAIYRPILDGLADHRIQSLGDLEKTVKGAGITFAQLSHAVMLLAAMGVLVSVEDDELTARARRHTDQLNAHLMSKARGSSEIAYLASPVSGGGVSVSRFEQLFMLAHAQGKKSPADWVESVWAELSVRAQRIIKDGKTLESREENLAELTLQAEIFAAKRAPILKSLQVF